MVPVPKPNFGDGSAPPNGEEFLKYLSSWRRRERLVWAAVLTTCDFESDGCDPSGQILHDLLLLGTAKARVDYLRSKFLDVSTPAKQEELGRKFDERTIIPAMRVPWQIEDRAYA